MPNGCPCDRFAVLNMTEAKFVVTMAAYLGGEGREVAPPFLSSEFDEWWGGSFDVLSSRRFGGE